MKNAALILERFDCLTADSGSTSPEDQLRADAFAEGYAAGQRAGESASTSEEAVFIAAARAIDSELSNAKQKMLDETASALSTILHSLLPAISRSGFAVEAADAIKKLAAEKDDTSFTVKTSPEQAEALQRAIIAAIPNGPLEVSADSSLSGAVAEAQWDGGGFSFDLEGAVENCLSAFKCFAETNIKEAGNDS